MDQRGRVRPVGGKVRAPVLEPVVAAIVFSRPGRADVVLVRACCLGVAASRDVRPG